jgi:hypothetical protein
MNHRPLLYIETSVFGFYYDEQPRNATRHEAAVTLLEQIRLGILLAATSPLTFDELRRSAEPCRARLLALVADLEILNPDEQDVKRLTAAYLRDRAVPEAYGDDARHVAFATVGKADVLVSFNLRHLANERAERMIGAVNLREGYQLLRIKTPEEVLSYAD